MLELFIDKTHLTSLRIWFHSLRLWKLSTKLS